jgi:hypothetical protein
MTANQVRACSRCAAPISGDIRPSLSYTDDSGRVFVCVDCLSWSEKDLYLSMTPRQRDAAKREDRFHRAAAPV